MSAYNVLVVDDSVFMRKIISDLIGEDPRFRVVDTAKNGREAVEKAKKLRPHIITMDVEMPEMNGIEALRDIMKQIPTPVIMLSSLTSEGTQETIQALECGAVDFLQKPSGSISFDLYKVKQQLFEKLTLALQSRVRKIPAGETIVPAAQKPKPARPEPSAESTSFGHIVAIGTSTGGPRALHAVLSALPRSFPAPLVVVQHMPPKFTKSLADRLDSVSNIRVVEAEEGMILEKGTAYIAPGGYHMVAGRSGNRYRLHLSEEEPRSGHRPSVDVLFESLIPLKEMKLHIVLMTGMGSDGASGMKKLKEAGAVTAIAEAEETCVVYGMPRAAVKMNGTTHELPLPDIPVKLIQSVKD